MILPHFNTGLKIFNISKVIIEIVIFTFQANRNNNNNTITANHNHSHAPASTCTPKPVIKTLKPVEEAEGPYLEMGGTGDAWHKPGSSPKQVPSPINDDYMQMNGPPGTVYSKTETALLNNNDPQSFVSIS